MPKRALVLDSATYVCVDTRAGTADMNRTDYIRKKGPYCFKHAKLLAER